MERSTITTWQLLRAVGKTWIKSSGSLLVLYRIRKAKDLIWSTSLVVSYGTWMGVLQAHTPRVGAMNNFFHSIRRSFGIVAFPRRAEKEFSIFAHMEQLSRDLMKKLDKRHKQCIGQGTHFIFHFMNILFLNSKRWQVFSNNEDIDFKSLYTMYRYSIKI